MAWFNRHKHEWTKWRNLFPSLGAGSNFQTRECLTCGERQDKRIKIW